MLLAVSLAPICAVEASEWCSAGAELPALGLRLLLPACQCNCSQNCPSTNEVAIRARADVLLGMPVHSDTCWHRHQHVCFLAAKRSCWQGGFQWAPCSISRAGGKISRVPLQGQYSNCLSRPPICYLDIRLPVIGFHFH